MQAEQKKYEKVFKIESLLRDERSKRKFAELTDGKKKIGGCEWKRMDDGFRALGLRRLVTSWKVWVRSSSETVTV